MFLYFLMTGTQITNENFMLSATLAALTCHTAADLLARQAYEACHQQ